MEDVFFKHIKDNKFDRAMEVYENNHIDVMFNDNCVIKYLVTHKKLEIIKLFITLDDFHEFSMDEPPWHFISIMTLACKHCYYELIEYLHEKFYNMTWMDVNDLISNTTDAVLVDNVVKNFIKDDSFAQESILCVRSDDVLTVMIDTGYKITEDLLVVTDNEIVIRHAHKKGLITNEIARKMMIHNYENNNIKILKLVVEEYDVDVGANIESFAKNFFYDPIDCFNYVFPDVKSLSDQTLKNIMNEAMSHRAHRIASSVFRETGVVPDDGCTSDVYDNIEYTKLACRMFKVEFKPKHLACSCTQNFKHILKSLTIDELNIEHCTSVVFLNENPDHVREFLKHVPNKILKKGCISNIFVLCCISSFVDLAKEIWIKYRVNISLCTVRRSLLTNNSGGDDFPINTPKRLVKSLLGDDVMLNVLTWVTDIFGVAFKYPHATQCLEEMYGNNPKILLHILQNITLNEQQLKNVFINVISHYENDSYYICKYLMSSYSVYMTDDFKEILYKYALTYTQKAYELFETDSCNVSKCFRQTVYGNNTRTFEHLREKYPEFLKSKSKSDELFRYACSCDATDIVNMFCSIFDRYDYKMDDDIIIPIVKNTIEYYIHNNEYDKILNILKKSKESFKNEDCNVCYEAANVKTECSHYYCVTCITKWYARNKNCPVCKRKLNIKKCQHNIAS